MATERAKAANSNIWQADVDALERDGFVVAPDFLEPWEIDALAAELDPWLAATPRCQGDFYGWRTTRVGGLLSKAPGLQHVVVKPRILAVAEAFLKPHCDCVQLNLTQAARLHPGERAQAPHRDEEMWPGDKHGQEWIINVMLAVDDFIEANGGTRVWPGSHREKLDRGIDPAKSIAIEMPRGSALFYLGSVTHGAGANSTNAPRTGVILSYCLGWLKTYENQFLAYPTPVARCFPERLQRLIGYQIHRPNLGAWEGQDPIAFLDESRSPKPHVDALTPDIAVQLKEHYGA